MESSNLGALLVAWLGGVFAIALVRWRRRVEGSGLLFSYLLNLWCIHWLAACIYLLPWYRHHDAGAVEAGFLQSVYSIVAFAFGSVVLAPVAMGLRSRSPQAVALDPEPRSARVYLIVGGASFLLLSTFFARVPTLGALLASGQQLLVIGLCLSFWRAWRERDLKALIALFGVTLLLPLVTIVSSGFLGYGAVAALIVFVFVSSFIRPRWRVATAFLVIAYLGFSFYVSYMRDRGEIREVVWGGKPMQERVEQVLGTIGDLEWFDPSDPKHLWQIDRRLNQNFFIGIAINRLSFGGDYALGETIIDSLVAVVPRAIWPDKPVLAGSGDLVSTYTGIRFAEGTSVGVGQVMEFYINFGTVGVIIAFVVMGVVITVIDVIARERLEAGDWQGFALWYLPGVSFLQVGGSLVEVAGTAAASVAAVLLVNRGIRHGFFGGRWGVEVRRPKPRVS